MDTPDSSGGDDGGVAGYTMMPFGPGMSGQLGYIGNGVFTMSGMPSLNDDGEVVSAGFLSGAIEVTGRPGGSGDGGDGGEAEGGKSAPGKLRLPATAIGLVDPAPDLSEAKARE